MEHRGCAKWPDLVHMFLMDCGLDYEIDVQYWESIEEKVHCQKALIVERLKMVVVPHWHECSLEHDELHDLDLLIIVFCVDRDFWNLLL